MTIDPWFDRPLDRRAPAGGERGVDGRLRRGGEFEPFYVPRPVMPQVDEAAYPDLFRFATAQGVVVRFVRRDAKALQLHQRIDWAHVHALDPATLAKPILVSADGFVLDGNHRAAAHRLAGAPIECIELQLEFEAAVAFLFRFPGVYAYGDGAVHPLSH